MPAVRVLVSWGDIPEEQADVTGGTGRRKPLHC